jgi:hypothetical protein
VRAAKTPSLAALGFLVWGSVARAQDFGYIDSNGLPAAGPVAPFFSQPSAHALPGGRFASALRSSVLLEPISGSQPSPDPEGTDTSVVSCLWLQEVLVGVGLGAGIDVALALPIHLVQSGQGLTGPGVGERIEPFAFGDVRLGLGVGFELGAWALRPFGTVYLPTGQEQDFAGERMPRGDLGVTLGLDHQAWTFSGSLAGRIRETSELSNVRWASQIVLGLAARYAWTPKLDTNVELSLAPTLVGQPEPTSGAPGYLFPAEVLLGLHYRTEPVILGLFGGTGLPLSVQPETGALTRGPTSPTLRVGVEIGAEF